MLARGNNFVEKLDVLLHKVLEVFLAAQASPAVPMLPSNEDPPKFGDTGRCMLQEEEEGVFELDKPDCMTLNKPVWFVNQRAQEQVASHKLKVGYHHGQVSPIPAWWRHPKGLTVIQIINFWLVGATEEHVLPL